MEQTLSLLFLMNPSPHSNYFGKFGKNISFQLGPNPVPLCIIFELQSTTLTNQPSHVIYKYNLNVRIHSTGSSLGNFHFLSKEASFCIARWEWGQGVDLRALALHYPIFPVFSTYPPNFLLMFSKHRIYIMFTKRFDYLRNILFSFYE